MATRVLFMRIGCVWFVHGLCIAAFAAKPLIHKAIQRKIWRLLLSGKIPSGNPMKYSIPAKATQIKMTAKTNFTFFSLGGLRPHLAMRRRWIKFIGGAFCVAAMRAIIAPQYQE